MSERLICPECGNDTFEQERTMLYDETCIVSFDLSGQVVDETIENSDCGGEDCAGAYQCKVCGWEIVDENDEPITDPDEIVALFDRASKQKHAASDLRETFQEFLEGDHDRVDVNGEQRGLPWFVEKLADCTDILPAGYCSQLDLPQGSTYGDAVAHLAKGGRK